MSEEQTPYLTRKDLGVINADDRKELTMDNYESIRGGINSRDCMEHEIERLTNRHIAKCLDHLGDTIAPVQIASIKRSFRFFAEDIKQVIQGEDGHEAIYRD